MNTKWFMFLMFILWAIIALYCMTDGLEFYFFEDGSFRISGCIWYLPCGIGGY